MNWNKLKKSILSAICVLGIVTIIVTCIAGMGYIAMTFPLIEAIILEVFIILYIIVVYYFIL